MRGGEIRGLEGTGLRGYIVGNTIEIRDETGNLADRRQFMEVADLILEQVNNLPEEAQQRLRPEVIRLAGDIEQSEASSADRRRI